MKILDRKVRLTIAVESNEIVDLSAITPTGTEIESVKPLIHPVGLIFYLNKKYGLNLPEYKN